MVLTEIVVDSSRKVVNNSSISDVDVVAAMVVAIDRTTLNDAVESVCAATVDMISRKTSSSGALVDVVAAIIVESSRRVAVMSSICDNDVVAAIVVEISRSMANDALESVCVAHAAAISRSTANSGALRDVVDAAVVVSSLRDSIPIEDRDVLAAIDDATSRRMSTSDADSDVEVAIAASISRRMLIAAVDPVCVARVDISSRNAFNSAALVVVAVAIVVASSRRVVVSNSI